MTLDSIEHEVIKQALVNRLAKRSAQVVTKSWFRMKWLTFFRGYHVNRAEHTPIQVIFGRVRYETTRWLLRTPNKK